MYSMPQEENIKSIFYSDIRDKKSAGRGGFHKRSGSKSTYVSLPSDHLTERGWRKMNGEVKSYNMNTGMSWEAFKELPVDLKVQYIKNLVARFNATKQEITDVFGISLPTFRRATAGCDFTGVFSVGRKMTAEEKAGLRAFFCMDTLCDHAEDVETCVEEEEQSDRTEKNVFEISDRQSDLMMREFTVKFDGAFDADHFANSLRGMVPKGTPVKIEISCQLEG